MFMKFCTILNSLKSPQNVGMIVRTHVAFGGEEIIITGHDLPWKFKKGTQSFSRKLEKLCNIIHIKDQYDALKWCSTNGYSKIAFEIKENPTLIDKFSFPNNVALIFGNESYGMEQDFLNECEHVITIPQIGNVGSLNVAISASIAMYEFKRDSEDLNKIVNNKFKEVQYRL